MDTVARACDESRWRARDEIGPFNGGARRRPADGGGGSRRRASAGCLLVSRPHPLTLRAHLHLAKTINRSENWRHTVYLADEYASERKSTVAVNAECAI